MKKSICVILFLSLMACSGPTLSIKADGSIEAKGYQAVSLKGENKSFAYKPWYHLGFLDTVIKALAGLVQ